MSLRTANVLQWGSLVLMAGAHMQQVVPLLAPASIIVFLVLHASHLRIPRPLPSAVLMALVMVVYIAFLLVVHNVIFDYPLLDVLENQGRLVYLLCIMLMFASLSPELPIEGRMTSAYVAAATAIGAASLFSAFVSRLMVGDVYLSDANGSLLGLVNNHNVVAAMLGMAIVLVCTVWLHRIQDGEETRGGALAALAIAVLVAAFVMARSRSFTMALVATALVIAMRVPYRKLRRQTIAAALVLGGIGAGVVLAQRDNSLQSHNISARVVVFERALREFYRSPFLGAGPGALEEWQVSYQEIVPHVLSLRQRGRAVDVGSYSDSMLWGGAHAHNSYLQMLCDFGIIGAMVFCSIFWFAFKRFRAVDGALAELDESTSPNWAWTGFDRSIVLHSLVYLAVASLFSGYTFVSPSLTLVMYAALGRLAVRTEAETRRNILEPMPQSAAYAF